MSRFSDFVHRKSAPLVESLRAELKLSRRVPAKDSAKSVKITGRKTSGGRMDQPRKAVPTRT